MPPGQCHKNEKISDRMHDGLVIIRASFILFDRNNFESEDVEPREGGSAFAAYYKGKQVVNIWGGYADYESSQPWREDSMPIVYSATKGR